MKKIYSLILSFFAVVAISAQMVISISGNTVKFTATIPGPDWGSTPVNLYAWIGSSDNTQGLYTQPFGNWPGTQMTDNGDGTYSASVDLSSFYTSGTTINTINFIYNYGGYQNPSSGGFSATDSAHATGWSPVTIATLAVSDVAKSGKSIVANGQLYTAKKGNLNLTVYDFSGKLVKTMSVKADGNAIDLNTQKGLYLVKISDGTFTEVVKFAK